MFSARKIDLVIFDLDGTLTDSLADIAAAANRVLAARDLPTHATGAYRAFVGEGVRRLIERAAPDVSAATHDALERSFRGDYGAHLVEATAPYPGVPLLLESLAARGVIIAVLSNKPHEMTRRVVQTLLRYRSFAAVLGHRPDVPRKPDPAGAHEICQLTGIAPARAALVGDTATDLETARRAGLDGFGVTWGFRDRATLEAAGAAGGAAIVDTPLELMNAILTRS